MKLLGTLGEACRKTEWQAHAYCLMSNHFHLISATGRQEFAGRVEARRRGEGVGEYEPNGWCLGSEEFREELLAQPAR